MKKLSLLLFVVIHFNVFSQHTDEAVYDHTGKDSVSRETYVESGIEVIVEKKSKPVVQPKMDTIKVIREVEPEPNIVFKAKDFEYEPSNYPYVSRYVYMNNKIRFVIAKEGDTFESLSKETRIPEKSLKLYNDIFEENATLVSGEVVYLQYKNNKSKVAYHTIKEGESMRYIAQKYAIPFELLLERNHYSINEFSIGNIICISCKKR